MKRFRVNGKDPATVLYGEQLATFAVFVQGEQFRFVVLRMSSGEINLTERTSGKRVNVLSVEGRTPAAFEKAGRAALARLVVVHGEARVRGVLAGA